MTRLKLIIVTHNAAGSRAKRHVYTPVRTSEDAAAVRHMFYAERGLPLKQ